jgi:hypothetical protein
VWDWLKQVLQISRVIWKDSALLGVEIMEERLQRLVRSFADWLDHVPAVLAVQDSQNLTGLHQT